MINNEIGGFSLLQQNNNKPIIDIEKQQERKVKTLFDGTELEEAGYYSTPIQPIEPITQIITSPFGEFMNRSYNRPEKGFELEIVLDKVFPRELLYNINFESGPWLAGGSIRRQVLNQSLKDADYDLFFNGSKQFEETKEILKLNGWEENTSKSPFATNYKKDGYTIQLIHFEWYNNIQELFNSFHFTICHTAWAKGELGFSKQSLWDLPRKRLVPHNLRFPMASVRGMLKYQKQGFYACQGCIGSVLDAVKNYPELLNLKIQYID
jgi:hypothetical protein